MRDPAMLSALSKGVLVFANQALDDAGLAKLLAKAPPLTEATLHGNALTEEGLAALLAHSGATLTSLNISSNPIGDAGLYVLARDAPPNLQALYADDCGASRRGIAHLLGEGVLDQIRYWSLGRQDVGDDGALVLVLARGEVHLEDAGLTAQGARALLTAGAATALHLDNNDLTGMEPLPALIPELSVLTCQGCGLPVSALASTEASGLKLLRLDGLDDADLETLSKAPLLESLRVLELRQVTASQRTRTLLEEAWGPRPGLVLP